ncbi:signal peptide peptidase-like 2A [Ornithodoros turicata]|uniref:signal peptide peptidase-like 2A n=1 Tax=Ornithodoros turicata TaxID=34597 RepID=UPI0031386F8D
MKITQFLLLLASITLSKVQSEYGVLTVEDMKKRTAPFVKTSQGAEICIKYLPDMVPLPIFPQSLGYFQLLDMTQHDACSRIPPDGTEDALLFVRRGSDCSFDQVLLNFANHHPAGILVSTPDLRLGHLEIKDRTIRDLKIVVAFIEEASLKTLKKLFKPSDVLVGKMSTQKVQELDLSLAIIWCLAVLTVAVGTYMPANSRHHGLRHVEKRWSLGYVDPKLTNSEEMARMNADIENYISPFVIVIYVFMMATTLTLLYFFYGYMVYVFIVIFTIASAMAVYIVLEPVMHMSPFGKQIYCGSPEVWEVTLIVFSVTLSVTWLVFRNHPSSWIMQNMLGIAYMITLLRLLHLPNFKTITLLLAMLFYYDIFFVFITPYFTASGESIMVQVAKGIAQGASGSGSLEKLPVLLKVPHISNRAMSACLGGFSLLGYGDIVVPGLLLSYCRRFDLLHPAASHYYITALVSYAAGLSAAFLGLYLMKTGQPALLYLVPATVIPVFCMAWCRGHLNCFWNGVMHFDDNGICSYSAVPVESPTPDLDASNLPGHQPGNSGLRGILPSR